MQGAAAYHDAQQQQQEAPPAGSGFPGSSDRPEGWGDDADTPFEPKIAKEKIAKEAAAKAAAGEGEGAPAEEAPVVWDEAPEEAKQAKEDGNGHFKAQEYAEAIACYTTAIEAAPEGHPDTAVYFANRAACKLAQEDYEGTVTDCDAATKVKPDYVKAMLRRMKANVALGKHIHAYTDAKLAEEKQPGSVNAGELRRMEKLKTEQEQKEQAEMMGKLKEMGNSLLGRFGLSTDNFQMEQNEGGSYNIQFVQNPKK